jgi:hypothetical protein
MGKELSNQRQYAENISANALRHHEIELDDDPNIVTSLSGCIAVRMARPFLDIVQLNHKGANPSNQPKLKHTCLAVSMIRNRTFLH